MSRNITNDAMLKGFLKKQNMISFPYNFLAEHTCNIGVRVFLSKAGLPSHLRSHKHEQPQEECVHKDLPEIYVHFATNMWIAGLSSSFVRRVP